MDTNLTWAEEDVNLWKGWTYSPEKNRYYFNDIGNEATITTNRLTKGTGGDLGEHIGDSNITDDGTVVSINIKTCITGSLSHGLLTTTSGDYSHAEGYYTFATAPRSHAEGFEAVASGTGSHAEGTQTVALGEYSHAEGIISVASGAYSHAEGYGSIAIGTGSHAEGFAYAIGNYSHAEGQATYAYGVASHTEGVNTETSGAYSHAEGYGTVASGAFQHVSGQYNLHGDTTSLLIIGNGTDNLNRSDIFRITPTDVQITGSVKITNSLTVGGLILGQDSAQISGSFAVTGSYVAPSGNTVSSDAMIQSALLYLSNNC